MRERADGEDLVDAQLCRCPTHLRVVDGARPAELRHVAEDRNAASALGTLDEIRERGSHRDGIRVVCVVDHEAAAGQGAFVAAPPREVDVDSLRTRQSERVERSQRSHGVLDLVGRREVEADPVHGRSPVRRLRRHLVDPDDLQIRAFDLKIRRNDRSSSGRQCSSRSLA